MYPMGMGYDDFNDPDYEPIFIDDATLLAMNDTICGTDLACIFDLLVTGDEDYANATLTEMEDARITRELFEEGKLNRCIV